MKKIILFLILLLSTIKVEAKTYYSNYSDYQLVDQKLEESDTLKLKIEEKYLIYKETKTEAFYPSYTKIENMNKTSETKIVVSDWLDEKPEELKDRKVIKQELYEYQDLKKIRFIIIKNIDNNFYFNEIRIFNKAIRLDYKVLETETNEILIDLGENVEIDDLAMMYYVHIDKNTTINFDIKLLGEEKNNIYAKTNILSHLSTNNGNNFSYLVDVDHFKLVEPLYDEVTLSETERIIPKKFEKVKLVSKYKYEDLYIKYEKKERTYLDDYYLEPIEGYTIDLDSKKEFYYIKTRDKIEIKDRLIIDNYNIKLEDFILNKTFDDIKITSNINYYKNGEYNINFILPFKTIKQKVIVDIKQNYIKALEVQNKYLKELEKQNSELFITNNNLQVTLKETLKNKDEVVKDSYEKVTKYKYENQELKNNKREIKEDIDNKYDYKNIIIVVIILLIIILTFIRRKKSIQNNN